MKILLANKYFYPRGGSEMIFLDTAALLEQRGHRVSVFSMRHPQNLPSVYDKYFVSAVDYHQGGYQEKFKNMMRVFSSPEAERNFEELVESEKPDVVHLHNIYYEIPPSIIRVLRKYRIPSVVTLHDFKIICANHLLLHRGRPCEDCRQGNYFHCFLKACIKGSRMKSLLATAEMYYFHVFSKVYQDIGVYLSPSQFLQRKIGEFGFQGNVVHVANFVDLTSYVPVYDFKEKCIVYFGRLSFEKGVVTLLDAMKSVRGVTLHLIGDGELRPQLEEKVKKEKISHVRFLGHKTGDDLKREIQRSMFVVFPSRCYENHPRSVLESFALGKPVVGANLGGIPELVKDQKTGLLFDSGDAGDLAEKINTLILNVDGIRAMGQNARRMVEENFNSQKHYEQLMQVYREAIARRKGS